MENKKSPEISGLFKIKSVYFVVVAGTGFAAASVFLQVPLQPQSLPSLQVHVPSFRQPQFLSFVQVQPAAAIFSLAALHSAEFASFVHGQFFLASAQAAELASFLHGHSLTVSVAVAAEAVFSSEEQAETKEADKTTKRTRNKFFIRVILSVEKLRTERILS